MAEFTEVEIEADELKSLFESGPTVSVVSACERRDPLRYRSGEALEAKELTNGIEPGTGRPWVDFGLAGTSTETDLVVMEASSIDFLLGCMELEEDEEADEELCNRGRAKRVADPERGC